MLNNKWYILFVVLSLSTGKINSQNNYSGQWGVYGGLSVANLAVRDYSKSAIRFSGIAPLFTIGSTLNTEKWLHAIEGSASVGQLNPNQKTEITVNAKQLQLIYLCYRNLNVNSEVLKLQLGAGLQYITANRKYSEFENNPTIREQRFAIGPSLYTRIPINKRKGISFSYKTNVPVLFYHINPIKDNSGSIEWGIPSKSRIGSIRETLQFQNQLTIDIEIKKSTVLSLSAASEIVSQNINWTLRRSMNSLGINFLYKL